MSQYTSYEALRAAVDQAARDIASLGYPELLSRKLIVGTNYKTVKWLGLTTKKKVYGSIHYILTFNIPYMRVVDDHEALNTIYHEVAHCINGGMCHTGAWLTCAERINRTYHLGIQRCSAITPYDALYQNRNNKRIHYIPVCKDCGKQFKPYLTKKGVIIKSILENEKRFYCNKCGSYNLYVKTAIPGDSN